MKAIIVPDYGDPGVLRYQEIKIPDVKADEILVRVHSAGVSPLDAHVREGWYKASSNYPLPIILGWELSGTIVQVGNQITRFKQDESILAHPSVYRSGGAYAEYVVIKENEAVHKPKSVTYEDAAAISMNALTAWQALFDVAQLSAGQKILIHAAAGGVGHLAVQLAKWRGAKVIGTASAKNKEFLLALGVDQIIDYQSCDFADAVKNVDVVLDTIGKDILLKSFKITKKGGIVVSIVDFENIKQASTFNVRGENVVVAPNAQQLQQIAGLLETGQFKAHIAEIFPLVEAEKAHRLLETGHVRGKILLQC